MLEIPYVAGLFDGEGYIRIAKWKKPNSIYVRYDLYGGINMTYRPIIEQLQRQFGGSLSVNRHDLRNSNQRATFNWTIACQVCARILRQLVPYLEVKKAEVELALQMQDSIDQWRYKLGGHSWVHPDRDSILAEREAMYLQISALKHQRFNPCLDSDPI